MEAASEYLVDTKQHSKLVQVPCLIPNKSISSARRNESEARSSD